MSKQSVLLSIVILLFPLAFFVGCSQESISASFAAGDSKGSKNSQVLLDMNDSSLPTAQPTPAEATKQDRCVTMKSQLNVNTAQFQLPARAVIIEKHFQRVIRKACSGKVTSDSVETVKEPQLDIELVAPVRKTFKAALVMNQNSCSASLTSMPVSSFPLIGLFYSLTGDGESKVKVRGDLSESPKTVKLEQGLNQIFIQYFYDCHPESDLSGEVKSSMGNPDCKNSVDSAIAVYPIEVKYVEKVLEGREEIEPTPEECQSQPAA